MKPISDEETPAVSWINSITLWIKQAMMNLVSLMRRRRRSGLLNALMFAIPSVITTALGTDQQLVIHDGSGTDITNDCTFASGATSIATIDNVAPLTSSVNPISLTIGTDLQLVIRDSGSNDVTSACTFGSGSTAVATVGNS